MDKNDKLKQVSSLETLKNNLLSEIDLSVGELWKNTFREIVIIIKLDSNTVWYAHKPEKDFKYFRIDNLNIDTFKRRAVKYMGSGTDLIKALTVEDDNDKTNNNK